MFIIQIYIQQNTMQLGSSLLYLKMCNIPNASNFSVFVATRIGVLKSSNLDVTITGWAIFDYTKSTLLHWSISNKNVIDKPA